MSTSTVTGRFRGLGIAMAFVVCGGLAVGWVSLRQRVPGTVEPSLTPEAISGRVEGGI